MSTHRTERALSVFERALDLDEEARAALLNEACGGDEALRREVVRMLDADSSAGFLELDDVAEPGAVPTSPAAHREGETIGPFRIRRTLGSGGMGIVYEAEQQHPRRRVALKMLPPNFVRPGADRRFRAEIELVARLDHPGVARVLEAGVHTSGNGVEQPYFAMEFVAGARDLITWGKGRSQRQRLELFVLVCDAIQHGHQQGVVHRDLKPANVLVGETNIPKVIDFGVAHAMDEAGELHTRLTQTGEIVGTLQYMAPEQLDGSQKIDTRTDVYALGLLLYELICGQPPYEFTGRSLTDIAFMIRDQPPRPIRDSREHVPLDVGWIIMRAVEKDPDRRYSSASELAADVRRFLENRPVEAGRPGLGYTLTKFIRRHRGATVAAVLVALSIVGGAGVALAAMVRANDEADRFRSINRVLTGMFQDVRVEEGGADIRAAELLDRAAERVGEFRDSPSLEADLRLTLLKSYSSLELHEPTVREARRTLELASELDPVDEIAAAYRLARGLWKLDRFDEAREVADRYLVEWLPKHPGIPPGAVFSMRHVSAEIDRGEGRSHEATQELEALLVEVREEGGASTDIHSNVELSLLHSLIEEGRYQEAERLARRRLDRFDEWGRSEHQWFMSRWLLARSLHKGGKHAEAQGIMEALQPDVRALFGVDHVRTRVFLQDLADVYMHTGEERKAASVLEDLVGVHEERSGPLHRSKAELGQLRLLQGRFAEAAPLLEAAWRGYQRQSGEFALEALVIGNSYAGSLFEQAKWDPASEVLIEVLAGMQRTLERSDSRILTCICNLAECHAGRGEHHLALERFQDALDWATEYLPEGNTQRLRLLDAVGCQLLELNRPEEAVPLYRELMRASESNPKLAPLARSEFRLGFANCLLAAELFDEAVEELETLAETERARVADPESSWLKELEAKCEDARDRRDRAGQGR